VVSVAWNETVPDLLRRLQDARQLRAGLNLLLILAIAHGLATLTWLLAPAPRFAPPPPRTATATPVRDLGSDDARIATLHLFGAAPREGAAGAPINAPETTLKLVLDGVLAATDVRAARAIIRTPNGTEKPYRVGDLLPGNAILKEIYPDRVLLERNGRYETLPLPRGRGGNLGAPARTGTAPALAHELRTYRRRLVTNPGSVFQLLRLIPTRQDGQFVGFRVYPARDRALFARVGLRPGDLVTTVNGIPLDDARNSMRALQALRSANSIQLSVLRGGQPVSLNLDLNP
jgi:general secretion pathway protein C